MIFLLVELFQMQQSLLLGIMPYISASIILQLMGAVVPYFQKLQQEGEEGRKKITQLTRYGTVLNFCNASLGCNS
jgi:preprotein translocase subunit SecY